MANVCRSLIKRQEKGLNDKYSGCHGATATCQPGPFLWRVCTQQSVPSAAGIAVDLHEEISLG